MPVIERTGITFDVPEDAGARLDMNADHVSIDVFVSETGRKHSTIATVTWDARQGNHPDRSDSNRFVRVTLYDATLQVCLYDHTLTGTIPDRALTLANLRNAYDVALMRLRQIRAQDVPRTGGWKSNMIDRALDTDRLVTDGWRRI